MIVLRDKFSYVGTFVQLHSYVLYLTGLAACERSRLNVEIRE